MLFLQSFQVGITTNEALQKFIDSFDSVTNAGTYGIINIVFL